MNEELEELRARVDGLENRILALDVVFNLTICVVSRRQRAQAADMIERMVIAAGGSGTTPLDHPTIKARIVEHLARLRGLEFLPPGETPD